MSPSAAALRGDPEGLSVEIREWIRSLGDRARLLVIIPLAAGSLAALVTLIGPTSFQASATLILPEASGSGSITGQTAQRVADFSAAVRSDGVLSAVSRSTGVPRGELDTVAISRAGSSGVIVVSYTSSSDDDVSKVADEVTRTTLAVIAQARVDAAQAGLDAAIAGVETADETLIAEQEDLGVTYSPAALEALQRQAQKFSNTADRLASEGQVEEAAAAQRRLDAKQNRINEMLQLRSLFDRVQAANQVVFSEQAVLFDAQGSLQAAETVTIQVSEPQRVGKLQEAARRFVFVAAIGFLLALALVLLLQLMDRRRAAEDEVGPRRRPAA
jgi:capsular polysaccharide biosynthesis protein